jgi:NAD(P)-dependent dehydrogenase (short-subunit alcohol dehydrogenase family)
MAPLADTHVVVLGGSWGIGYAVAKAALTEGARVTIASSSASKIAAAAERLAKDIGGDASRRVRAEVLNLKDETAFGPFFTKIGVVDHLVSTVSLQAWTDVRGLTERTGGGRPDRRIPRPRCGQYKVHVRRAVLECVSHPSLGSLLMCETWQACLSSGSTPRAAQSRSR